MPKQSPPLTAAKRALAEEQRKIEERINNQRRLDRWELDYTAHHGHPPVSNINRRFFDQSGASA